MKYGFKSLENYEWDKLFAVMEAEKGVNPFAKKEDKKEDKEDKKDDKKEDKKEVPGAAKGKVPSKNPNSAKEEAAKFAQQEQKDLETVFKKLIENFKKFQISAGGKPPIWIQFVTDNLFKGKGLGTIQNPYKLWDTDYVVGCSTNPEGANVFVVRRVSKEGGAAMEEVLTSKSREACKKYNEFYKAVKATVVKFKKDKQEEQIRLKKEKEAEIRKQKLGSFLQA